MMGMTTDSLSHWQAESEGTSLLDTTIGDLLDHRADELPAQEAVVYSCYPAFGDALNLRWTYQEYRERPGGVFCHTAIVARKFGIPAVVGTGEATARIRVDGTSGTV